MTKIDFYVIDGDTLQLRDVFACRLVEKAFRSGFSVYIHCADLVSAKAFDEQLWAWKQESFLPHHIEEADVHSADLIQIGYQDGQQSAKQHNGLLVNLSQRVPDFFSRFERLAEIVVKTPEITSSSRESYRFYRDRGYALETHNLQSNHQ